MKKGMFALFKPAFCEALFALCHLEISCFVMFYKMTIFCFFSKVETLLKVEKMQ